MIVLLVVPMISLPVMMALAYLDHGNAMYLGVTALVALVKMKPIVDLALVMTVHTILQLTALNAVIQLPMNLVLAVQHSKPTIFGIAPAVIAHLMKMAGMI